MTSFVNVKYRDEYGEEERESKNGGAGISCIIARELEKAQGAG
jgi:hypothetical protein